MAERENVVDFTVPYYDLVGITILMKKPKVPTSLFKFLTVLEPEVWVCILFAYGFTRYLRLTRRDCGDGGEGMSMCKDDSYKCLLLVSFPLPPLVTLRLLIIYLIVSEFQHLVICFFVFTHSTLYFLNPPCCLSST